MASDAQLFHMNNHNVCPLKEQLCIHLNKGEGNHHWESVDKSGFGVVQDMLEGSNFKTAAKRRATRAGQRMAGINCRCYFQKSIFLYIG